MTQILVVSSVEVKLTDDFYIRAQNLTDDFDIRALHANFYLNKEQDKGTGHTSKKPHHLPIF